MPRSPNGGRGFFVRRRDATPYLLYSSQPMGRPKTAAFALSLAVHTMLLGLATREFLRLCPPPQLIPVVLRSGGGNGESSKNDTPALSRHAAAPAPPEQRVAERAPRQAPRRVMSRRQARHRLPVSRDRVVPIPVSETADEADVVASRGTGGEVEVPAAGESATQSGTGGGAGGGVGSGNGEGGAERSSCVYCPEPRYPLIARARGWEGTVHIGLSVSADGTVENASLQHSSGFRVLDEAAVAAARQSRFNPPAARGLPAPLQGRIEYRFVLTDLR